MSNEKLKILMEKFPKGDKKLLISLLQETQDIFGYLPEEALEKIGGHLNVPLSNIYGVITFYSQFYLKPTGKYRIKVCAGTACHVRGAPSIIDAITDELKIKAGETSKDLKYSLDVVYCLGTCFLAPVIMINDKYYGKLSPESVRKILKNI